MRRGEWGLEKGGLKKNTRETEWTLREGKHSDSGRKSERCEEQEVYLGTSSIEPPIVGNPKAHETNRLWAQIGDEPNGLVFWVPYIYIYIFS